MLHFYTNLRKWNILRKTKWPTATFSFDVQNTFRIYFASYTLHSKLFLHKTTPIICVSKLWQPLSIVRKVYGPAQTDYFCVCGLLICYFHAGILPRMSLTRLLNTLIIMLRITRLVCIIYWKVLGLKPTGNCHVSLLYISDCFVCVFCKNKWQPFICL